MKAIFLRSLEIEDKRAGLQAAIRARGASGQKIRFEIDPQSFARVPLAPFAYWVSDRIRDLFVDLPAFEGDGRTAKQGLATADDFRFVRTWWAAPPIATSSSWFPFAKGGSFSPF